MDQLKIEDCPFCGGVASLVRTKDISRWWYVECKRCFTRTLASQTMGVAAGKWNKRHSADTV